MPYISKKARRELEDLRALPANPGEITFIITVLLDAWLGQSPGYADYATAVGILETAKLELYRRQIAPYEDTKIQENGDVYRDRGYDTDLDNDRSTDRRRQTDTDTKSQRLLKIDDTSPKNRKEDADTIYTEYERILEDLRSGSKARSVLVPED